MQIFASFAHSDGRGLAQCFELFQDNNLFDSSPIFKSELPVADQPIGKLGAGGNFFHWNVKSLCVTRLNLNSISPYQLVYVSRYVEVECLLCGIRVQNFCVRTDIKQPISCSSLQILLWDVESQENGLSRLMANAERLFCGWNMQQNVAYDFLIEMFAVKLYKN